MAKLDITLKRSAKAKHGLLLTIAKPGQNPFVYARPLDKPHAKAIAKRFEAWSNQGWPYVPKDEIPAYMVKTSQLIKPAS